MDKGTIRGLLKGKTKAFRVAFAYRCALRSLPLLGVQHFECWVEADRKEHLFSVLWVYDVLEWIIRGKDASEVDAADANEIGRAHV